MRIAEILVLGGASEEPFSLIYIYSNFVPTCGPKGQESIAMAQVPSRQRYLWLDTFHISVR